MTKPAKVFRKQAERADAAANLETDPARAANLKALAEAFRAQADVLKAEDKRVAAKNDHE